MKKTYIFGRFIVRNYGGPFSNIKRFYMKVLENHYLISKASNQSVVYLLGQCWDLYGLPHHYAIFLAD